MNRIYYLCGAQLLLIVILTFSLYEANQHDGHRKVQCDNELQRLSERIDFYQHKNKVEFEELYDTHLATLKELDKLQKEFDSLEREYYQVVDLCKNSQDKNKKLGLRLADYETRPTHYWTVVFGTYRLDGEAYCADCMESEVKDAMRFLRQIR